VAGRRHLVVPAGLHQEVLSEHHEAMFAGHFAPMQEDILPARPILLLARNESCCVSGV